MAAPPFRNGLYKLCTAQWRDHYVYMQDSYGCNVRTWRGEPGTQGWWQLINHPSMPGFYLLSPWCWPDCFIFMERGFSGNIRGWNHADPGPQGYFKFVPQMDRQTGQKTGNYLLTTQQWENDWFTYVESWITGNLSAWRGDPGPQGWFRVEPCNHNDTGVPLPRIGKTVEQLAAMPQLNSKASGYLGPSKELTTPQLLAEVQLILEHAEGKDLHLLQPTQRIMKFHVDQSRAFRQRVGRQSQMAFFDEFVPNREQWSTLSRSIFELRLEPPALAPTLVKLTQTGSLCVGSKSMNTNESVSVGDGTLIHLGGQDGHPAFLVFRVKLRRSTQQEIAATMQILPGARGRGSNAVDKWMPSAAMKPIPELTSPGAPQSPMEAFNQSPVGAPKYQSDCFGKMPVGTGHGGAPPTDPQLTGYDNRPPTQPSGISAYEHRPPTDPQYHRLTTDPHWASTPPTVYRPPADSHRSATPIASHRRESLVLDCAYSQSAGLETMTRVDTAIELRVGESVMIGRSHQANFFEKLLTRENLVNISRSHVKAEATKTGEVMYSVAITNMSTNPVKVDDITLRQGSTKNMMIGSSLKFIQNERTLLIFQLRCDSL